jgi:glycosyltransferase involved in cell wall biosynthesis
MEKKHKFDICQVFFGIPSGPIGYLLKKKYKVPYIIRFGGGDIPGFQDRFAFVYKIIGPFLKIIWNNADALVANSEGLRQLAMEFHDRNEIKIINNGVDTDRFYPKKDKTEADRINILFVSRLIERKGLQFVIPKLKYIQDSVGKEIHLTIVGDGPYRDTLEKIAVENDCGSMVSFAGQKDKEELLAFYQAADIFILPSKKEGMPNVVLEAMASGLPIVMTPCEGSKELVTDNGIVTSIDEFADNLIKVCSDRNMRISMGQNSLRNVENNFQWKSKAEKYMKLICGKEE